MRRLAELRAVSSQSGFERLVGLWQERGFHAVISLLHVSAASEGLRDGELVGSLVDAGERIKSFFGFKAFLASKAWASAYFFCAAVFCAINA